MKKSVLSSLALFKQVNFTYSKLRMYWKPLHYYVNNLNNNLFFNLAKDRFYNTSHKADVKSTFINNNEAIKYLEESRNKLISRMNFVNTEDAKPFYTLPTKTLVHIYQTTKNDNKNGYCSNRLYYIAEQIKCPPAELSELLAKRTFVYSLSFEWLKNSLNKLLEMGVPSDRILRDLWVLKYKDVTIHNRLQAVKDLGIETLFPWMVRCKKDILNRYITISQETKDILGNNKSSKLYLADRLNVTPEAVEEICARIPALQTIRVTKVKRFVDFLIAEGFQPEDIANKPRVLAASPNTVKLRLEKLRKIGLQEINLNVLCKSRKDFQKYCESLEALYIIDKQH